MDFNTLNPCDFAPSLHFVLEIVLCNREQAVAFLQLVEHIDILLHFLAENIGHYDSAVALFGFRAGDYIFLVNSLIGFVYRNRFRLEIKVVRRKRQKLALSYTAPIEHFKGVK